VEQQGLCFTRRRLQKILDPFGLVTWPGSVIAVLELLRYPDLLRDKRVLVLGAGVGVEAQAAAMLGAAHVLATDIHPTTLRLLQFGAEQAGRNTTIDTQLLDIFSKTPLPECDVMIVADVLYNDQLAVGVAKRCIEARTRHGAVVVVSDSQRFVNNFEADLNQQLRALNQSRVSWVTRWLPQFTGSGVCIDGDQTYDVKARVLWIGLDTKLVSSGSMATMKP
jgi:predicted nicotinamide N-methyase